MDLSLEGADEVEPVAVVAATGLALARRNAADIGRRVSQSSVSSTTFTCVPINGQADSLLLVPSAQHSLHHKGMFMLFVGYE